MRHAPYITIGLGCSRPLFPVRAFDFWFCDSRRVFTDIIDATSAYDRANGQGGRMSGDFVYMLSAQATQADFPNLDRTSWLVAFAQRAAATLEELLPSTRGAIEEMRVLGFGHNLPVPTVGAYTTIAPHLSAPVGNILFAGADTEIAPSIESALQSGFAAADRAIG